MLLKAEWATLSYDLSSTNRAILILVSVFPYCAVGVEGKHGFRSRYFEKCARARPRCLTLSLFVLLNKSLICLRPPVYSID